MTPHKTWTFQVFWLVEIEEHTTFWEIWASWHDKWHGVLLTDDNSAWKHVASLFATCLVNIIGFELENEKPYCEVLIQLIGWANFPSTSNWYQEEKKTGLMEL